MKPAVLACALAACGSASLQPQSVMSHAEAAQTGLFAAGPNAANTFVIEISGP